MSSATLKGRLVSAEGVFGVPDGGISANKLADGAVTGPKIAQGAVTEDKLASDSVTGDKIANDAVTVDNLANGAVTADKLADAVRKGYVRSFETVADMQSATDLLAGMTCHTNGFHASGDGGAAYYTVSANGTANGMDVLALQGGLLATLVVTEPYVTPEQFGAWGDGTHDDTAALKAAVTKASVKLAKTYLVSTETSATCITVPSDRTIEFDGATVTLAANALTAYSIFNLFDVRNVRFCGTGSIIGDKDTHTGTSGEWGSCININNSKYVSIDGLTITKGWGDGIYVGSGNVALSEHVNITNCDVSDNSRNNISVVALEHGLLDNLTLNKADRTAPKCGVDFEPNDNSIDAVRDVIMTNCTMRGNEQGFYPVLVHGAGNNSISIVDCTVYGIAAISNGTPDSVVNIDGLKQYNISSNRVNMLTLRCADTSSINIRANIYDCNDNVTPVLVATEANNISLALDLYGNGVERACAVFGQLATRSNVVGKFRYFMSQTIIDGSQEAQLFDKYTCEFGSRLEVSSNISAPSRGCDYELIGDNTFSLYFRPTRTQPGTRFVIRNKSTVNQYVLVTPADTLASGHIGIYEATSFGVINKILDIATSS